jgi:MoaA/NifB/PqqE/SkfB family radical SAM enzyme
MAIEEIKQKESPTKSGQAEPTPDLKAERRKLARARRVVSAFAWAGPKVARFGPIRRPLFKTVEKKAWADAERRIELGTQPPGVIRDRTFMAIAIVKAVERGFAKGRIGRPTMNRLLNVLMGDSLLTHGFAGAKDRFVAEYGSRPPGFFLISPTKTCNLRCTGCYADSGPSTEKLEWPILNRMIREARELWGLTFIVLSGGEPFAYRDEGKTILDLAEANQDMFFLMYTNGTLIDDDVARRLSQLGNLTPAISVEGLGEATDKRRGPGVHDKIVAAMERLRRNKVIFGVSMTATRDNADALLSDEVIDFYYGKMGALYGWLFHYMPMGRALTLDMLPTPEQRLRMWHRARQLVQERQVMLADFWNSGTASNGCVSSGHPGGYLTVDWDGKIAPCVFVPYTPLNIHDVYAQNKTLNDVWAHPFLAKLRDWQYAYSNERTYTKGSWHGNWMMPCPIRDHYDEFFKILKEHNPEPIDENARAAMEDPEYFKGMVAYNREVDKLFKPIWEEKYMKGES